ncbi:M36 family metallopeptidase [Hymenobacter sp. DG25B]|uniref:M36 family metallopeptidase n=1 Tax=Hymenobacter sp. DG25B TaxID=1385664 RepID=UPI0009E6355A|nr:M36 family metallopeptidase [Hymenobacter sp. DG25B]
MRTTSTLLGRWLVVGLWLALPRLAPAQSFSADYARQYLSSHRAQLGLTEADVAAPAITDTYTDAHNGVSHVYLRQQHLGLEVLGTEMSLHFDGQGEVLTQTGKFVTDLASKAPAPTATVAAPAAMAAAAQVLHLTPTPQPASPAQSRSTRLTLYDAALSTEEIPTQLAYAVQPDGSVKLVWQLVMHPPKTTHQWSLQVDATTGKVLKRRDRNPQEKLAPPTAVPVTIPFLPASRAAARPSGTDATYNVFAVPVEAPGFGPRSLARNPADAKASPYGWHDNNGVAGPEYTTTRGNNASTYIPSTTVASYFADGGTSLNFDFAYDAQKSAVTNKNAALTQLFYLNNIMHDISFQYGFTEAAGNFQTKNYTGLGKGSDAVRALAQDPDGVYNAYFSAAVDGKSSAMHMFLWPGTTTFKVTGPSSIAGQYPVVEGAIGPSLSAGAPITGKLVLVDDGSAAPTLGCTAPLKNAAALKGNIALIDRGTCTFSDKVQAAQNAGAIAAVVVNNQPDTLITMSGDYKLSIPSVFMRLGDGNLIKERLKAGETVTISMETPVGRDGAFDNAVVAHEYTHGISIRLTGGPASVECLNNKEQMGEGWSDFFALWLTTKPGDTGTTPRSIGSYVMGQATSGVGIRNKFYSTDMAVNDFSYAIIGTPPFDEEHSIGEVWASVLWDLNWEMIKQYGYSTDLYRGTGGNNKTMQLVMDGLKLQKCSPGFLDGRDAILAADKANNKGVNQALIWRVFARRGMGSDAVQGSSDNLKDNKAGYAMPTVLATTRELAASSVELYPNPAQDQLTLRTFGLGSAPVQVAVYSVLGTEVLRSTFTAAQAQRGSQLSLGNLADGVYMVRISTPNGALTRKVVVQH